MLELPYRVNRDSVTIKVLEDREDVSEFRDWYMASGSTPLAVDTETSGLNVYARGWLCRTVQIGDGQTGWVFPLDERSPEFITEMRRVVRGTLEHASSLLMFNSPFDLQVLHRSGLFSGSLRDFQAKVRDVRLAGHLLDPRASGEGNAVGLSLKGLCAKWVDWQAIDPQSELIAVFRKEFKTTKDKGWAAAGLTFHHLYLTYAGLDVIYTARLWDRFQKFITERGLGTLLDWEHEIQAVTLDMEARGVRIDVDYTQKLSQKLREEGDHYRGICLDRYGIENINSTAQVVEGMQRAGIKLTKKTPSGNFSVGKEILLPLAGLTPYWDEIPGVEPHPLAESVAKAKRADKWRTAYVDAFLDLRDKDDRVHPRIASLQARTARLSISEPPLQQLPAGDWSIRRCIIPDDGHVFISTDFSQVELRVVAALAQVKNMISAIRDGVDLHNRTSDLIWPEGWTKIQRGISKNVSFCYVYGGGAGKVAETAGIPFSEATSVVNSFMRGYPELAKYAENLQASMEDTGYLLTTPYGRQLPVDPQRAYAVTNFCVDPRARILTSDLRHVSADTVRVGDRLVGFDENRPTGTRGNVHRRFRVATVEKVSRITKPRVRVRLSSGQEIVVSADHQWLVRDRAANVRNYWVEARALQPHHELIELGMWDADTSWEAGYLAGLYDGEGCLTARAAGHATTALRFSQNRGPVMDMFCDVMRKLDLPFSYHRKAPRSTSPCDNAVTHGVPNIMRVLGTVRPSRFMARVESVYDGASFPYQSFRYPSVVKVEDASDGTVIAIQTTTRTMVVDGLLSHNCVQSTARDLFCEAMLDVDKIYQGRITLPIHDELLTQAPLDEAEEQARQVAKSMGRVFQGVPIDADSEIAPGGSWGSNYGCPPEFDRSLT